MGPKMQPGQNVEASKDLKQDEWPKVPPQFFPLKLVERVCSSLEEISKLKKQPPARSHPPDNLIHPDVKKTLEGYEKDFREGVKLEILRRMNGPGEKFRTYLAQEPSRMKLQPTIPSPDPNPKNETEIQKLKDIASIESATTPKLLGSVVDNILLDRQSGSFRIIQAARGIRDETLLGALTDALLKDKQGRAALSLLLSEGGLNERKHDVVSLAMGNFDSRGLEAGARKEIEVLSLAFPRPSLAFPTLEPHLKKLFDYVEKRPKFFGEMGYDMTPGKEDLDLKRELGIYPSKLK